MAKQKTQDLNTEQVKTLWHTLTTTKIIDKLSTSTDKGLSSKEATDRLSSYGKNELEEKKGRSPFKIFLSQFNDFMI